MHAVKKTSALHHRIVIVGGGFAGVMLAQQLESLLPVKYEIVVISAQNHLVFTPMLPEVVGRTISPLHVVVAGRQLTKRTRWIEAAISHINREEDEAHYVLKNGEAALLKYSHLIFACGSMVNLGEIPGLASRGYPLKTMMDALVLGNDLIGNFETAAAEADATKRQRLLTVVVIGGGFSGVEVAGHIADLMRAMHRFYPELRKETPRTVLLQKGDRILPELNHPSLSSFALKKLRQNTVDVRLKMGAKKITAAAVQLSSGDEIEAGLVVCTIGTDTQPLITALGLTLVKGRLKTDPDMRVTGTDNLWAIGDCALIPNAHDGQPSPATAQFAEQQARQLAANLAGVAAGASTSPFSFRPRGMLASIGHRNAVAEIYGFKLSGFAAWFLWRGVYLWKLPTVSRKLEVAVGWAWSALFSPNLVQLRLGSGEMSEEFHGPHHARRRLAASKEKSLS
jgi:NADH dehydrogenase